jgi:hypothetical protein
MSPDASTCHCLNCQQPETDVPLVSLRYAGQAAWICSRCLPLLIHQPERLIGRLPGAEGLEAAPALE